VGKKTWRSENEKNLGKVRNGAEGGESKRKRREEGQRERERGGGGQSGDGEGVREDKEESRGVERRARRGGVRPVQLCFPEGWFLVEVV
jgi:hypothetical protein